METKNPTVTFVSTHVGIFKNKYGFAPPVKKNAFAHQQYLKKKKKSKWNHTCRLLSNVKRTQNQEVALQAPRGSHVWA